MTGEDVERVRYVQRIQLETEMYDMFRNSMRIMINKVKHIEKKKRIEDIVFNGSMDHDANVREIMRICREMGDPMIHFTAMQAAALDAFIAEHQFKRESTAFMRCISAENRIEYGAQSCMRTRTANPADGGCIIILPHKNLVNGIDNRTFYYGKLADELLRYTRIRRFILSASSSLSSLSPMQYDLHPDEIMLFQSQLESYFDHLEPGGGTMNRFARYTTHQTANPDLNPGEVPSHTYVEEDARSGTMCAPIALKPLSGRASAHYFPATMQLLSFEKVEGECTFEAFLSILREERAEPADMTVRDLKTILVARYVELMRTHKVQMMNYYKQLTTNRTVLAARADDFVMNSFHYMTHLDLWILAQHFRVPIVLFSAQQQHPLIENKAPALVLHYDDGDVPKDASDVQAYYVMTLGRLRDVAPMYSIVRNAANEMKFSLSQCTNSAFVAEIMKQAVIIASNPLDLVTNFIANYVPSAATKRIVLKANEEVNE